MALSVYKPDQGYWTRLMTALGGGILVAATAGWLWTQLEGIDPETFGLQEAVYVQGGFAVAVLLIGGFFVVWLSYFRKPTSEFLINVESEMRKVNWSTRKEIFGSTRVVILISLLIAIILFVVDLGFSNFFKAVGLLQV